MSDLQFSVDFDVDVPCVVMTWRGYATSAAFRQANEAVLEEIRSRRARKMLGEIADFVLIGGEDQDWLNKEWLPRAMEAGLRVVALVQPNFYFNRVAVESVASKLDPASLQVAFFATPVEARAWLKSA